MALVVADRVKETTTTTGTGTVTLAGAETGFQSFSAVGNGNTTYYTITNGTDWEVGVGTYTASGTTLSRDTVLSSSNSGSLVNFGAGTKEVFITFPAELVEPITTFEVSCSFVPIPTNSETLGLFVFTQAVQFPADWSSAQYESATLPTASTTITIYKNPTFTGDEITGGTTAGTVVINTSGVATFATTGGTAVSFAVGDSIGFKNQGTADATARGSFTLKGVIQ